MLLLLSFCVIFVLSLDALMPILSSFQQGGFRLAKIGLHRGKVDSEIESLVWLGFWMMPKLGCTEARSIQKLVCWFGCVLDDVSELLVL